MSEWSLQALLGAMHHDIEQRLEQSRRIFQHPTVKGDASEKIWSELLSVYLPERYSVDTAHVVDVNGSFSDQIDVVVFDRQYSPFIFFYEGQKIIPAESVYAVFEAKQSLNSGMISYAQKKVASVRSLHRTSLPIPHAGGVYDPKPLPHIWGGILSFESDWKPPLGDKFLNAMNIDDVLAKLDIGCCASHGSFWSNDKDELEIIPAGKPAASFLLELIAKLQNSATVPMIDVRAYAAWLAK